ncbi:hypothetical protein M378DRAFT_17466 [Amanita muscaria Koide BX008]|uniref:Uncharacterized protein n=1 Tax=Amanita muscaria (strain Koide BX008) TaxID=946122 RepID=A0A0C2S057_AMAMK|nr:hypothetical protein M378DRAFT_17466 [Amanita muscaria Koide BX008]
MGEDGLFQEALPFKECPSWTTPGRATPSIAAMIYPFGGHYIQKFYWGTKDSKETPPRLHRPEGGRREAPEVVVLFNFASSRSDFVERSGERSPYHWACYCGLYKPGYFRIGNSGGMMENFISSKLYRPGSVGYVSKSGGMSNELSNMLSLFTHGTIAIGGDRYPGSTSSVTPNRAMGAAGFVVSNTFEELPRVLKETYQRLVKREGRRCQSKERKGTPYHPYGQQVGSRTRSHPKPAAFISTISDERGQELLYAGMRISDVFKEDIGVAGPPTSSDQVLTTILFTKTHATQTESSADTINTGSNFPKLHVAITSRVIRRGGSSM